ncbi:MAG: ABC transporter substrate-binding protein [Candidatus Stahlbacteria bacterium]|nr:ABC transporter substrate-binding protein [Candidatus Stahlbacteria bacterium]
MRKLSFVVLGVFLLCGCAKEPVKIGVVVPLSGALSSYGDMCLKGIKLAAKQINENGGIKGRQVELIIEDTKENEDATRSAIEGFDKQGVVAVVGPLTTKAIVSIGEYADKMKLPVITPAATGVRATKNREWVWRVSFTDLSQGAKLADFTTHQLKAKSVCILLNPQDPYSVGLSESFETEFAGDSGKVLFRAIFNTGDTAFKEQLKVIKGYNPDCIFVPAFYREAGLIVRQARDMGIKQPFIGGDGWDSQEFQKIIGDKRPGANYYSTHFFYNYGGAEVQNFLQTYKTEYEEEPQTFSALGYDALMVIQECFRLTRRATREEFKDKIKEVVISGATGSIDFSKTHDPSRSLIILKFEPGTPIEVVKVTVTL